MPDERLRAALLAALALPPGRDITRGNMAALDQFLAYGRGIADLTGLEFAVNLAHLGLDHNSIADLRPLAELDQLRWLTLFENHASDASPLAGLQGLELLDLRSNGLDDVSPLGALTGLKSLHIGGNAIMDLRPLAALTDLRLLSFGSNRVSSLEPLSGLVRLEYLGLFFNRIADLSPLSRLTALKDLSATGNAISDLRPLSRHPSLEQVFLSGNVISDLRPLSTVRTLRVLNVSNNQVSDLAPLAPLDGLEWLDLDRNRIGDIAPLAGLTSLTQLELADNSISDLGPLAGLTALERLDLRRNTIRRIAPLVANPGLGQGDIVHLVGNPLSEASLERDVPALRRRGAVVYAGGRGASDVTLGLHVRGPGGGRNPLGRDDELHFIVYARTGDYACAGTFELAIDVGGVTRYASSGAGRHGPEIELRYVVGAEDRDDDGISVAADALRFDGGVCRGPLGHAVPLDLVAGTVTDDPRFRMRGGLDRPPAIAAVSARAPSVGRVYGLGEPIAVRVEFTEPVVLGGIPSLQLDIGGRTRRAALRYVQRQALEFVYRVAEGDVDRDGLRVGRRLRVSGGPIRDTAGQAADLRRPAGVADLPGYRVDGAADGRGATAVAGVSVTARRSSATLPVSEPLRRNDRLDVAVRFTSYIEPEDVPTLALRVGRATRRARLSALDGAVLHFEYRVRAGDRDDDGLAIERDALTLPAGASVVDGRGAAARLDLGRHAIARGHRVLARGADGPATIESIGFAEVTPRLGNRGFGPGESLLFRMRFDGPVRVDAGADPPVANVRLGPERRAFALVERPPRAYGRDLLFEYRVQPADRILGSGLPEPGSTAVAVALRGATVRDRDGRPARLRPPREFALSWWRVNGDLPAPGPEVDISYLSYTRVAADPGANGSLGQHEVVEIPVHLTRPVTVTGTPKLPFRIGGAPRNAHYVAGGGTRRMVFRYRIGARDLGLVDVPAAMIDMGDGAIADRAGHVIDPVFGGVPAPDAFGRLYFANGRRERDTAVPPLAVPGDVRVDPGTTEIRVSWVPLADDLAGGAPITAYVATARPTGGGREVSCTASAASGCVIEGLDEDTEYQVTVHARNALGPGYISAAVIAPTLALRSFWRGWRKALVPPRRAPDGAAVDRP